MLMLNLTMLFFKKIMQGREVLYLGIVMKTKLIAPTSLMTVSSLATLPSTKQTMKEIIGGAQEALYLGMLISQVLPMNLIVAFL